MCREWLGLLLVLVACGDGPSESTPGPVTELRAVEVVRGLTAPLHLTAPQGDARLFVVEQRGVIRIVAGGTLLTTPFLDISALVAAGGERGLLSMAFDPLYPSTGWFWVNYTALDGSTRVVRYRVSSGNPNVADPASAVPVLQVAQPFANHNGGQIAFGPDGLLYIGMGDGGSAGDPQNHGQNLGTLLGAMLRIDVRSSPYAVPPDNPFVATPGARPEIWAYGLRNPWRFSFDPSAGMLYIADVGQNAWEEINAVPASSAGLNYGWRIMEGRHCYNAASCSQAGLTLPVHEYSHSEGCSVTGGFVYRGALMQSLRGHYFYSDYCAGFVRSFRLSGGTAGAHAAWSTGLSGNVLSFGEDGAGELYVLTSAGIVYRLEPAP